MILHFAPLVWALLTTVSQPSILVSPSQMLPGGVSAVYLWVPPGQEPPPLRLLGPQSRIAVRSPSFLWEPGGGLSQVGVGFIPLGPDFPPGDYTLVLGEQDQQGKTGASVPLKVLPRKFPETVVQMTPTMKSLVSTPDPRKTEQSRKLNQVIGTWDPTANRSTTGFVLPVEAAFRQTSLYGDVRKMVDARGRGTPSYHWGTDYAAPTGTPILAPASGKVVLAENRILTGNTVVLEHYPGFFSLFYHMDTLGVKVGQSVVQSQTLGTMGMTGFATGSHLHWEVRVHMVAIEPQALLGRKMVDIKHLLGIMDPAFLPKRG